MTHGAVDLGESTVNIRRSNLRRNSNPSVVLNGVNHGLTAGMTEKLVQPENLTNLLRSDASASFASKTGSKNQERATSVTTLSNR